MPAFIHRFSKNNSILILYVTNQKDLDFLNHNLRLDEFLNNLKENCSKLQDVLKIRFVLFPESDLEKIKINSIALGEFPQGIRFNDQKLTSSFQSDFSFSRPSAKEKFANISRKLKKSCVKKFN